LGSRFGKAIRFSEDAIRAMGRTARGVHAMRLRGHDQMIDMSVVGEGMKVLSITENGYGKRSDPELYREQGRNGMGIIAMTINDKTGQLVAQLTVNEDEDILLMTDDGTIIRMAVADIRETGRNAQGVRLMRVGEGAKIVAVTRAEQEDEAEEAALEDAVAAMTENDDNVVGESAETAFDAGDDTETADKPTDDGEI
jgi:DNA gyrase subunit A